MRHIMNVIEENGLTEELEERLIEETGNVEFCLAEDSGSEGLDEGSDREDPETILRKELSDRHFFVQAAQDMLQSRSIATDLERARMELEDLRSQTLMRIR